MPNNGIPFTSGTESRKPISASVKTEVYTRAKGRCESCGKRLIKSQGDYHHWRSPKMSPSASTVQFLCPDCHKKYGHIMKVVVHRGILRKWKETTIVRVKVKKHPQRKTAAPPKKQQIKKKTTPRKRGKKNKTTQRKRHSIRPSGNNRHWYVAQPP